MIQVVNSSKPDVSPLRLSRSVKYFATQDDTVVSSIGSVAGGYVECAAQNENRICHDVHVGQPADYPTCIRSACIWNACLQHAAQLNEADGKKHSRKPAQLAAAYILEEVLIKPESTGKALHDDGDHPMAFEHEVQHLLSAEPMMKG